MKILTFIIISLVGFLQFSSADINIDCSGSVSISIPPSEHSSFNLPVENDIDYLVIGDSKYCDSQFSAETPASCKPTKDTINIVFVFSPNECQYTKQVYDDNILSLTFKLTTLPVINSNDNLLSYKCVQNYVTCNMTLEPQTVSSLVTSVNDTLLTGAKVEEVGVFDTIDLKFYDSDAYSNETNSSLSSNEYVFVELGPTSKAEAYNLTATTCYATPGHSNSSESPTYFLIENGCASTADPTTDAVVVERNQDFSVRFKFKPFVWASLNYGSELHVYCDYHVCFKEMCQPPDSAESDNRVPELNCSSNLKLKKQNFAARTASKSLKITYED